MATGLLILAIGVGASQARAEGGKEKVWRAACRHDAFVFCTFQALTNNRAGVRDCLVRNLSRISEACQGVIRGAKPQSVPVQSVPAQGGPAQSVPAQDAPSAPAAHRAPRRGMAVADAA
jgi:hypothetical protein